MSLTHRDGLSTRSAALVTDFAISGKYLVLLLMRSAGDPGSSQIILHKEEIHTFLSRERVSLLTICDTEVRVKTLSSNDVTVAAIERKACKPLSRQGSAGQC